MHETTCCFLGKGYDLGVNQYFSYISNIHILVRSEWTFPEQPLQSSGMSDKWVFGPIRHFSDYWGFNMKGTLQKLIY